MASNSKKRRRVLGVSCILAALIIASSSFAWFTSKDEVTNRLTANADYGVSIVESFAPPKNWLPGQEINKDVYAVNTGTVDAYVKEKITGVLNYTYEQVIDTLTPDCVQLTPDRIAAIDGATTEEAGGYLAWTDAMVTTTTYTVDGAKVTPEDYEDAGNAEYKYKVGDLYAKELSEGDNILYTRSGEPGSYTYTDSTKTLVKTTSTPVAYPTGSVNSARENTNPNTDTGVASPRWTPPATGAYIFRRSIDTTSTGNSFDNPSFTYAGYYFVKAGDKVGNEATASDKDRYYEIVIGNDAHPTDGTETYPAATDPGYAAWNFDVNVTSGNLGNDVTTGDPITVNSLGEISGTPRIRYVKEYTVDHQAAEFAYDPGDNGTNKPATLTVQYTPATIVASSENVAAAQAALTAAETALSNAQTALTTAEGATTDDQKSQAAALAERNYEDKLGAYNTALSRYNQTKADFDLAVAVATATNTLYDAADARAVFQAQLDDAEKAKKDAWNDANPSASPATPATDASVVGKAAAMVAADGTYNDAIDLANGDASAVSFAKLFGNASKDYTDDSVDPATRTLVGRINHLATTYANSSNPDASRFTSLKENMDRMHGLWAEINTLMNGTPAHGNPGDDDYVAAVPGIKGDLTTLATDTSEGMAPSDLNKIETRLTANIAALKEKMTAYNNAWNKFKRDAAAVTSETLTEVADDGVNLADAVADTNGLYDAYFDDDTGLEDLIEAYKAKYNTWHDMADVSDPTKPNTLGKAKADWTNAVNAYNSAINTATGNYNNAINEIQPELNNYYRLVGAEKSRKLTDQSAFILNDGTNKYAAEGTGSNGKFDGEPAYTTLTGDVTSSTTGSVTTYTAGSKTDKTVPTAATFEQVDTSDAAGKKESVNDTDSGFKVFKLSELSDAKDLAFTGVYGSGGTVAAPKAGSPAKVYADAKAAIKDVADKRAAVATAQQAKDRAQNAYNDAVGAASPVKIIVQLADDAEDLMWQYDGTNTGSPAGTEADFYYKKVLGAGETSEKLIDSVYLDKEVKSKAYKTLVFDLNVGLDSIQVTYDADQRNYSTESVNATSVNNENDSFKLKVTNADPITKDTVLTWGTPTP